ncbi:hypothetical protein M2323_001733 [Rhodoblastus acidophilus]|uniref:DUF2087 domain-containing protein n=1 Tax=Rhodoblastus acidophilus TaxID=1074 RepID=UPI0022256D11|nr:DUF2087 domain-containing protein [Rhodoblastus acidophilus]MCW2284120.1 hypothetical protein [Rhodoblastus acidophilus]MCW2332816.1 hypothetical protein [Rhodoblastus acidophilus]
MSREAFPYSAPDASALAKALRRELDLIEGKPGHVQLLNILARAVGFRNFQHFRAAATAQARPVPAPPPVDFALVQRVAGHFDEQGRLLRWPSRHSHRLLALWALWSRLPAGVVQSEAEINQIIRDNHCFGDHAVIRRALVDEGLLARTSDCREYRRIEQKPPGEALALIRLAPARAA